MTKSSESFTNIAAKKSGEENISAPQPKEYGGYYSEDYYKEDNIDQEFNRMFMQKQEQEQEQQQQKTERKRMMVNMAKGTAAWVGLTAIAGTPGALLTTGNSVAADVAGYMMAGVVSLLTLRVFEGNWRNALLVYVLVYNGTEAGIKKLYQKTKGLMTRSANKTNIKSK